MRKKELIDYDGILKSLLLEMVKLVFKKTIEFKKNYTFFITISTCVENVKLPKFLKDANPLEMSFYINTKRCNLEVKNKSFLIDLKFKNSVHRVSIPFEAIVYFSDNKEKITLNFDEIEDLKDVLSDTGVEEYKTEIGEDFFYEIFSDLLSTGKQKQEIVKKKVENKENDNLIPFVDLITKKRK